ncbi:MAG: hypothetical protein L0220_12760, partial [Acidobacteria bacterium]|nr:hypothetical protein [Acidobacteriota bacterium]
MKRLQLRYLWQRCGADIAVFSAIAIFFVIYFWRAILGGTIIISGDPLVESYPLRMVAWEAIRNGTLPLWTPLILSGYPLLSMAQVAVGYPFTWGYLFLPGHWAEQTYILVPYLLAPVFTYAYAREVGCSRLASLLAGLSFGYGGLMYSSLAMNGMLSNACMWLPLFLIAIERARTKRFIPCILLATGAYSMSVLSGIGQGFVYTGMLALVYGFFVFLFPKRIYEKPEVKTEENGDWRRWKPLIVFSGLAIVAQTKIWTDWRKWRPLAVTIGAISLAAGVAAFQILETLRAASLSVRAVLSYEQFSDGSFPLSLAFKAWLQPIYPYGDVTLYVPPLATGLAIVAVVFSLRQSIRNPLVIFWLIVTITAFIMILGKYTPINYLFYNLPFINRFRIPSRHSFEWTFALSILGAFGWDAIASVIARRQQTLSALRERYGIVLGIFCLVASLVIGIFWWRFSSNPMNDTNLSYDIFHYPYLTWKAVFTLLIFFSAWQFLRMKICRWRIALLASVIALACFFEPFIEHTRWHPGFEVPASRFSTFAPTTHFLRQYPPINNRVYSDASPYEQSLSEKPILDSVNLTALAGLHHVAGYEPLMLERYARALNNAPWETVPRDPSLAPNPTLFESRSLVLDLLNTTFAIVYSKSGDPSDSTVEKDGIRFSGMSLGIDVKSDKPISLTGEETIGDTLGLVTSLDNASHIPDNAFVAKLSIYTDDGRVIERHLRAGIDTADLAYERANTQSSIRHSLARVFDSHPGNSANNWSAHSYLSRIDLGTRVRIKRVEIVKVETAAGLRLFRASLYDSASQRSTFFSIPSDSEKWQIAYQNEGVKILRNTRALPRAWLVTDAVAVSKFEAWATIRGQSNLPFDPRRTA